MRSDRSPDLVRTTLQLLTLGILIVLTFLIVRPFLVSMIWAIMIAVSTWPLLLRVQRWLGGRRSLAVALMTIALLLTLVLPLILGISAVVGSRGAVAEWSQTLATHGVPPPPPWVGTLPLVGAKITATWQEIAAEQPEQLAGRLRPYLQPILLWFVGQIGGMGLVLLQFLLSVTIAAILYANGETVVRGSYLLARRLAGSRGENALRLAAQAIRAVALGVVVTAVVQSALGGIGLAVAGVPFAVLLVGVIFILSVAQLGAAPVLLPAVIWVYLKSGATAGTLFLIWAIICMTSDNFLRPVLIRRGADLPLLLIFAGVMGGLVAFGVLGIFIGPMVLAVAYTLISEWLSEGSAPERDEVPAPSPGA
jgi:predicted PurR-regulated permease PerM